MLIHLDKLDIHWNMGAGQTENSSARTYQPYHTASIAKSFTSVIVAMLVSRAS